MSRAPLIISLLLLGCVGSAEDPRDAGGGRDGFEFPPWADGSPVPDAIVVIPDAAVPTCRNATTTQEGGHHHAGDPCLACHSFSVGGTLYENAASNTPRPGIYVQAIDSRGVLVEMISAQNGNFWTDDFLLPPLTVFSSDCPDLLLMEDQAMSGDCNAEGCHDPGNRVHAP